MGGHTDSSRSQSFPTIARVRKRREFQSIQRLGRRHPTRHFLVVQSMGDGAARLGITVTRKIGTAVERNRVKRAVREAFRRRRARLPRGLVLVVIARDGAAMLGAVRTAEELAPILQRLESPPAAAAPPVQGGSG